MYPIDTQDGLFHDGDGISELGTILPASWLNQIQQELIAVLSEAGIIPEKANTKQVVNAIKLIISNSTAKFATQATRLQTARNINGVPFDGTQDINATPAGAVQFFAISTAPTGWLKANGAEISRITYANLFAAIGTTFGAGDGKTTFNLPDLRGEFLRGWDDGRGVDTGRALGSYQLDMMAAHSHSFGPYRSANADIGNSITYGAELSTVGLGGEIYGGVSGGSETRPRNIALLACIKI
ncbi:phage tail protein [Snodgrassella communis]|uniref:phage tail protein n=2 Tax=Snodgrassella TaxID=1193515 RepID=UPI001EF5E94E|nr:phage tail protein [Snodgrassella communis]